MGDFKSYIKELGSFPDCVYQKEKINSADPFDRTILCTANCDKECIGIMQCARYIPDSDYGPTNDSELYPEEYCKHPDSSASMYNVISHPSHYTQGREFEPKDVIRDWELNFNLGSAVKYISRAGRKDDIIQDLKKARQFLDFEIEYLERTKNNKYGEVDDESY